MEQERSKGGGKGVRKERMRERGVRRGENKGGSARTKREGERMEGGSEGKETGERHTKAEYL